MTLLSEERHKTNTTRQLVREIIAFNFLLSNLAGFVVVVIKALRILALVYENFAPLGLLSTAR